MTTKVLAWVLSTVLVGIGGIGVSIGTAWVNGVNADREIVRQLQFKDLYINGSVPAAPVAVPVKK